MITQLHLKPKKQVSPEQLFMASAFIVNGGNYLYNLVLGRVLGPAAFADAAVIITLLLILSFLGMTFQLVAARYVGTLSRQSDQSALINWLLHLAAATGIVLGLGLYFMAPMLQQIFQTTAIDMFQILSLGVPIYFIMSVNRGIQQGSQDFLRLATSYQLEMWTRLVFTLLLIIIIREHHMIIVSSVIVLSLIAANFPRFRSFRRVATGTLSRGLRKSVIGFFLITAFYELTQIAINNGDILMVKHFFDAESAGLYAALALIGRIVYFITWMFAMILIPEVLQKQKEGIKTNGVLITYVCYSAIIGFAITSACFLFPQTLINLLFGSSYLAAASLLWKYALATTLFAVSNIFVYYFLAMKCYAPVALSAIFAVAQLVGIAWFHRDLQQVVHVQMLIMFLLNLVQWGYFLLNGRKAICFN